MLNYETKTKISKRKTYANLHLLVKLVSRHLIGRTRYEKTIKTKFQQI
jgi:hypothetical protein